MTGCTCNTVWNSILPPPPCPIHAPQPQVFLVPCCGFGCSCSGRPSDTMPLDLGEVTDE